MINNCFHVDPLAPQKPQRIANATGLLDLKSVRPAWLRNLLTCVAKRFGAVDDMRVNVEVEYVQIRIDQADLLTAVSEATFSVHAQYGRYPDMILMGRDEYYRIMASTPSYNGLSFDVFLSISDRGRPSFLGMKIIVVPWMNGILPMFSNEFWTEA